MTPVCTDTPNNARKPTLDETLMLVCVTSSASNPPTRASATLIRIKVAHLNDLNIMYRMMKINRTVSGTIIASRLSARCLLSYSPAHT